MTNSELHTTIANVQVEIARLQAVVKAAKLERLSDPASDAYGNITAQHGCDRCECGNKYWEFDCCIDCGQMHKVEKN